MEESISDSIVIKPSLRKKIKGGSFLIFWSLVFVLGGFWMVGSQKNITVGLACILFFGFTLILSVKKYVLRGISEIHITKEGIKTIFFPVEKEIFIPWNAINDVWVQSVVAKTNMGTTKSQNLHLSLKNPEQFIEQEKIKSYDKFFRTTSRLVMSEAELEKIEKVVSPLKKPHLSLGDDYEMSLEELVSIIKGKIKVGV